MQNNTTKTQEERNNDSDSRGRLFVVGTGPGALEHLTGAARAAIEQSTTVVGYKRYVSLIEPLLTSQNIITSKMTEEVDRCKKALEVAASGETVAIISSGDAGVYGMAGLVMELALATPEFEKIDIEVVPGITAVSAAASIVGAPLTHDFAVVSLSDLMTPWEVIAKRLRCAAEGDFVIALYNPKSNKRTTHIIKAREIIEQHRGGTTPVAIVTNAYREGQSVAVSNLRDFAGEDIGMLSVVIIGNSQSILKNKKIVTPRGYSAKYADSF